MNRTVIDRGLGPINPLCVEDGMLKRSISLLAVALGLAFAPTALSGQNVTLAGSFGAGVEYSFGRWGIRAEGRDYVYRFDRLGFDRTQHDIAWQGGITASF